MEDVNISKYRAQVVRAGSTPASPGFVVSEGQNPVDPSGSGQNHLPVTIATAATGLSITESQVLGGAGTVGQYIRGDGSLADFPESSGGGSSVSYYLNGSVAQGTIGGVAYKELNKVPILGAGTDFTINADGYIASFITDAGDPNLLEIPAGNWNFETYFSASSGGGSPTFYVELYKVNSGGTATLIASNSTFPELIAFGTNIISYFSTLAVPTTALALTDRLAIRYYVTHSGRTITLHTEDNHLCQIITTFTTGLTALNGLTAQIQNFAVGTSGTDFAIASATATHTFNLPTASATNRGALSSADWTTFNNKTSNLGTVTSVGLSSATSGVTIGSTPVTTSGTITLAIATASGSQNGLLSSTDWTTFNSKQNALTNPVTGTGTSGRVAYWNGTNSITSDADLLFDGSNLTVGGNITLANGANRFVRIGSVSNYNYDLQTTGDDFQIIEAGASIATPRLTIKYPNGNVLIGTTTDNGAKLQVSGTATFSGPVVFTGTTIGLGSQRWIGSDGGAGLYLNTPSSTNINFAINYVTALALTSTGAAIFNSSVSGTSIRSSAVGSFGFNTANNGEFQIYATAANGMIMAGRGSSTDMVITNKNGSDVFTIPTGTTIANFIGNVGIGDTNPTSSAGWTPKLVLNATSAALVVKGINGQENTFGTSNGLYIDSLGNSTGTNNNIIFRNSNSNSSFSATERMRVTSSGFFKASDTGTYALSTGSFHELINSATGNNIVYLYNTAANPYGPYVRFSGAAPNNSSNYYLYFDDTSTVRFRVDSNGGISNYQANDVNLSDERTKKEIAPLESYWDKFKNIEIVKFKYKDQTHDDFNIGVIAQQVEKVAPEFVDVDGWDNKTEGNKVVSQEEPIKSIYTADLHHATIKVLQEAMAKIESMQKEIDTLKN